MKHLALFLCTALVAVISACQSTPQAGQPPQFVPPTPEQLAQAQAAVVAACSVVTVVNSTAGVVDPKDAVAGDAACALAKASLAAIIAATPASTPASGATK